MELIVSVTVNALLHLSIGDLVFHVRLVLVVNFCVEDGDVVVIFRGETVSFSSFPLSIWSYIKIDERAFLLINDRVDGMSFSLSSKSAYLIVACLSLSLACSIWLRSTWRWTSQNFMIGSSNNVMMWISSRTNLLYKSGNMMPFISLIELESLVIFTLTSLYTSMLKMEIQDHTASPHSKRSKEINQFVKKCPQNIIELAQLVLHL